MANLPQDPIPVRSINVHIPHDALFDLGKMQKITAATLDRLGCAGCHSKGLRIPYLDEVLAYEHAILRASLYGEYSTVTFKHDPSVLLGGLQDGILDTPIPEGDYAIGLSGSLPH